MDVPLFPAPPILGGVATPVSDVIDVAKLTPVSLSAVTCTRKQYVEKKMHRALKIHKIRHSTHRNLVHPKSKDQIECRVTKFHITMTEQQRHDETEDDNDVVFAIDTPTTISEEISPRNKTIANSEKSTKSIAIQTIVGLPLRLRVLPSVRDIVEEKDVDSSNVKGFSKIWKHIRFLGRLSLSLFGLIWLLTIWTIVGAVAFCAIEGPREREQVVKLKNMQKDLAVGLATELRQLRTEKKEDVEPLWSNKVHQYVEKHEELLLMAVNSGYGENGNSGQLWTFPGCILFALSLLTTLGNLDLDSSFGAPVPRTTIGRTVTVIFAAIGIPAHFLLIMNLGLLLAVRLQRHAIARKFKGYDPTDLSYLPPVPKWVKIVPFVCVEVCENPKYWVRSETQNFFGIGTDKTDVKFIVKLMFSSMSEA
ncbi:TWiK family of potassium channels protein 7 [Melipona quadrifasciata]|uniref:TWiK family of potassium channels protein 7 n=1 Tax=Melipona quadrifasciata TaxID=166423 RepID=A0A0M8ZPN8_9HYME|nr:TWiK family of potassium channels protein 7 [Melipona quadrifasciata]